ncbi:ABC transporter ATP-binding protein [Moorena producens]|uniref:ABC transporter ATP-binding protein n=1 Tax=Moorena producens TaxID=1155739 RepID=UPI003C75AB37
MDNQPLKNSLVSTFKFAWHYWSEYRYTILFVLVFMSFHTLLEVLVPILTGKLVNGFSNPTGTWTIPAWICAYLAGVKVISYICRLCAFYLWSNTATQVITKIFTEAFDKVQHFSTEWHINHFAGSLVRNIIRGTLGFDQFSNTVCMSIYPSVLTSIALIVVLFWNGFWIGIVGVFGFIIFFYAINNLSNNYLSPAFEEVNQVDSSMNGILSDAITCNSLVKAFAAEEDESLKFRKIAEDWRIKNQRLWWRIETFFSAQVGLFVIMEAVIVSVAIWLWFKGIRTAGDVITILTSFQMAQGKMREISNDIHHLRQSVTDLEEIVKLDKIDAKILESPEAVPLEVKSGSIAFDQVTFGYKNQTKTTYENFSVTIAGGEKVALVGHSGSGKSTFIKLIQRLYDVQDGKITIDGKNIYKITKQSLRSAIAVVPQEPILFHRSIAENIGYAKPNATRSEIEQAAHKAYAHDFIINLPDGYDTQVGERGVKLSGGERQRVAIARAILADCPILVLDEATSSLDSVSEALIQKALDNLMIGRTTIIIAHRLSTIKAVDRILVFSKGEIVEEGSHETLLANLDSRYYALYSLQSDGFMQEPTTEWDSELYENAYN